jgi:hypothetical protein
MPIKVGIPINENFKAVTLSNAKGLALLAEMLRALGTQHDKQKP